MAEATAKKVNVVGITINSKEDYDRLMQNYSIENTGFFLNGIDFKGLFQGYPEEDQYPCLIEYYIGDYDPFGIIGPNQQLKNLLKAGYHLHLYQEDVNS